MRLFCNQIKLAMIRSLLTVAVLFMLLNCFSSCLNDKADALSDACDTTYYGTQIRPIIETKCAISGCHVNGGAGTGDFTRFSEISARAVTIKERINITDVNDALHMPQGDTLSDNFIMKINEWVDAGAIGCE